MKANLIPPGPKSWVPGQLLFALKRQPLTFLQSVAATYGDISHFRIGPQHIYLVNHPDLIKEVLVTNHQRLGLGKTIRQAKGLLGEGLLTSEGEEHRRQRKNTQPAFHHERIAAYGTIMAQYSADLSDQWRHGQCVDAAYEMKRLALRIAGKTLFAVDVEAEANEVVEALTLLMEKVSVVHQVRLPLVRFIKKALRGGASPNSSRERIDAIIYRVIAERRAQGHNRGDELLSMLMQATEGEMTDRQLRDELVTLFIAGHETTANALTWAWYLLAKSPEVEAKLRAELRTITNGGLLTASSVGQSEYLQMFTKEVLRLYPPVWLMSRRVISDIELNGYIVPAGSLLLMSQYVMHRDARYFRNPTRFDPERWRPGASEQRPLFSYFPFGGGPRRCIGEHFAWLESGIVMATLASGWRMRLVPHHKVELQPLITLRAKNGILMKLEKAPL